MRHPTVAMRADTIAQHTVAFERLHRRVDGMKELFSRLESVVVMLLVLIGLAGLSYNLFRADGWVEKAVGNAWDYTMRYPLIVGVVAVGAFLLSIWWRHDMVSRGHKRVAPTIVLYLIMAAGAYYIGHLVLYGTL